MLVLAVESATEAAGIALVDEDGPIAELSLFRGRRHAETVAPAIRDLCKIGGCTLGEVDAVAVDIGPGLFTSLRVGIGTAKGLALGLGVPLVTATSLEVLATAVGEAYQGDADKFLTVAVVDVRRKEVAWAWFGWPGTSGAHENAPLVGLGSLPQLTKERIGSPGDLVRDLCDPPGAVESYLIAGDGALRYRDRIGDEIGRVIPIWPSNPPPVVLGRIGLRGLQRGEVVDAAGVSPLYLRPADVRISWEKRERKPATP